MSNIREAHKALVARICAGDGEASCEQRRAAFDNARLSGPVAALIQKVAAHAYQVGDEDVNAARAAGVSDDAIFELVVCAAIGQATRQYDTALATLEATEEG